MKTHELISLIKTPLRLLNSKNVNLSSIEYIDMYYEYVQMKNEGLKKTYIVASLCEKHNVGRTKFLELINLFDSDV